MKSCIVSFRVKVDLRTERLFFLFLYIKLFLSVGIILD